MKNLQVVAVDDTEINLIIIEELLKEIGMQTVCFLNPYEALEHLQNHPVDLMFVDYMMPQMNGIEFIQASLEIQKEIIPIMITAVNNDKSLHMEALEAGAADFLTKPIDIAHLQAKVKNFTKIIQMRLELKNFNEKLKDEVKKATQTLIEREHEALVIISKLAEYRDPETGSHIARVAHYSKILAKAYGLSEEEQDILFFASPLHDIGKVGIKDNILLKPGKLDDHEFAEMQKHTTLGYEVLQETKNPYLHAGMIISKQHHEKYSGKGYPNGLAADEIHIYARITAVADVFDALTSARPYKKEWSFSDALDFLKKESGEHFEPRLIELFEENLDEIQQIYHKFKDWR